MIYEVILLMINFVSCLFFELCVDFSEVRNNAQITKITLLPLIKN